ncbi:hypothetical protein [Paraburkholderia phenoliruptrix]|uniref:hypothetical protein n=1 Tax=Paraburkholderia phenoliruptrix TaxID=252970 RepID=UPI00285F186F|nr:hypothetical protein [Paraburkholderia phenoliruptrix]MDR6393487.1 hypothetical protein [Paraburkholderia phenoliruptrix]
MSTPTLVSGNRMQKTGDWLFEQEQRMKVLVDKQDSHDYRLLKGIETGRPASNDDEREWTDDELLMDPIDWYMKRLPAEIELHTGD